MGLKQQPWVWVFVVVLITIASLESRWSEGCLEQERFALLQLKPFFNTFHEPDSWVEEDHNSDCCQWYYVTCNDTTGRVISLELFGGRGPNSEMGEWYLNASLFSPFQQLQTLYLIDNGIAGCVENEGFDKLSTLSNLEALYLSGNSFNNSILSSLNTLSSLKNLSLSYNKLNGIVDIQGLRSSNLEYLDLSGNIFNNSILSFLSLFSSLKTLYLFEVGLKGCVDLSEISDSLSNLVELYMGDNQINKLVVTKGNRTNLRNLQWLSLQNVSIHNGSALLQSLGSFSSLKTLDLSFNNFSGIITSTQELHNFTNLEELYMLGSSLHTSFLQSIAAFTSLERLTMIYCQFNGILGIKDLSNLKNLKSLSMVGTNLSTSILQSIEQLTSLEFLSLDYCNLEGIFPYQDLYYWKNLKHLSMNETNLNISILQGIGRLTSLEFLSLQFCNLNGTFPDLFLSLK